MMFKWSSARGRPVKHPETEHGTAVYWESGGACVRIGKRRLQTAMIKITGIGTDNREEALNLVWKTFRQYEAPDYSEEGLKTFYQSVIENEAYLNSIQLYGAYDGETPPQETAGIISLYFLWTARTTGRESEERCSRRL
jgi:hypothetical protein